MWTVAEQWKKGKMHSYGYRVNALLTFAITILAVMSAMASLSDNLNSPTPFVHAQVSLSLSLRSVIHSFLNLTSFNRVSVQVTNINWFQKQPNGDDEVILIIAYFFLISNSNYIYIYYYFFPFCCLLCNLFGIQDWALFEIE